MSSEYPSQSSDSVRGQSLGVRRYLNRHKIEPLLTRLLESLLYNTPDNQRT
ncbi:hypothetical protein HMI56_003086 [Coelomomyces lativittatus]|nr:hypothetical protein HMI56_003086 [Coelomomyces lativittatus]